VEVVRFFLVWSRGAAFHRTRWAPIEPALAQVNADFDPICRLTESAELCGMQAVPCSPAAL
jgi:hypothetical protein